jgi:hypothetical protein
MFAFHYKWLLSLWSWLTLAALWTSFAYGGNQTYAIFFLGDSTNRFLINEGYSHQYGCRAQRGQPGFGRNVVRTVALCDHPQVKRVGYFIHWGVSDEKYLATYIWFRTFNDTDSSVTNIYNHVKYFQDIATEDKVLFVVNSNYWDAQRQHSHFPDTSVGDYADEFYDGYYNVIQNIQMQLRPADSLIIQLVHRPGVLGRVGMDMYNALARATLRLALNLNLPLFRCDLILQYHELECPDGAAAVKRPYLYDDLHQNADASQRLVREFTDSFIF